MKAETTPAVAPCLHFKFRGISIVIRSALVTLTAFGPTGNSWAGEAVDLEDALDAFSGEWEGEVEVRALDGVVLKTFPMKRTYRWDENLQVVETLLTASDDEYGMQSLQSVRLGRLYSLVTRPFSSPDEYVGIVRGGVIDWTNTLRNDRDFSENISIERGVPKLEISSVEALRFSGITGVVRLHAVLRPKSGRIQLGSVSRAEVAALTARIKELEAALEQARAAASTSEAAARVSPGVAETEVGELTARMRELERDREELRRKLTDADRQFVRFREVVAESERRATEARRELTKVQSELEAIRVDLAGARAERDEVASIAEWRRRLDAALAARDEAVARLEEQAARIDTLREETETLRTESAEATTLIEQAQKQLAAQNAAHTELTGLKAKLAGTQAELENAQANVGELTARIAAFDEAVTTANAGWDSERQTTQQLNSELRDALSRVGELEARVAASTGTIDEQPEQLRAEITQLEKQLEETQLERGDFALKLTAAQAESIRLAGQVDQLEATASEADARRLDAAGSVTRLEQQNAGLRSQVTDLSTQLGEINQRFESLRTERDQWARAGEQASIESSQLGAATRELETARAEIQAMRGRLSEVETALNASGENTAELERERDALLARVDELEARRVVPASENERVRQEADQRVAQLEQERQAAVDALGKMQAQLRITEQAKSAVDSHVAELESELEQLRAASTELARAHAHNGELESSVRDLAERLERVAAERDAALEQTAAFAQTRRQVAALQSELEAQQAIAVQRQADNESLVRRNERLVQERDVLATRLDAAEKPPEPAAPSVRVQGVGADGTVSQNLLNRSDELDRRVIELESERNALSENSRLLESQLTEARTLRDDTLARFQDVVSQLNAMREERDRLARANVALQSDLRAARQPAREVVQDEAPSSGEADGNVFTRLISAIGAGDVPRTPDTVIASLEVIGITHSETEDKVILNGRLYHNGDTIDSDLGLVFQRIDGDALVFTDQRGREYRRRF